MLEEWSRAKLKWTWEYTIAIWYDCSTVTQPEPSLYDGGRAAPVKVYEDLYYDIKKKTRDNLGQSVFSKSINIKKLSLVFDLHMVLHLATDIPHAKSSISHLHM